MDQLKSQTVAPEPGLRARMSRMNELLSHDAPVHLRSGSPIDIRHASLPTMTTSDSRLWRLRNMNKHRVGVSTRLESVPVAVVGEGAHDLLVNPVYNPK